MLVIGRAGMERGGGASRTDQLKERERLERKANQGAPETRYGDVPHCPARVGLPAIVRCKRTVQRAATVRLDSLKLGAASS